MASEYSILTDVAAGLGTYRLNRESEISQSESKALPPPITTCRHRTTSVHAEAELLLNLMATAPDGAFDSAEFQKLIPGPALAQNTDAVDRPCIISPSFSFEAKRTVTDLHESEGIDLAAGGAVHADEEESAHDNTKGFSTQPCQKECFSEKKNTFSISCPSLSLLHDNDSLVSSVHSTSSHHHSSPSYLFSRPIQSEPLDIFPMDMSHVANSIATNLVQSFKTAMEWRTKTWIKALTQVLSVRYQSLVEKLLVSNSNSSYNNNNNNNNANTKRCKESIKEDIKKSHEARVIRALSKAASNVVVHDVRTTFFVLEEQNLNAQGLEYNDVDDNQRPPTKKIRQISRESMETPDDPFRSEQAYDLSHAATLDARCSVSTSPSNKITVSFRVPGVIRGKFVRDDDGNVHPRSVDVTLDTDALAMAMEENSRHVIRSATEEWMVSPPNNFCTIYDTVQTQDAAPIAADKVSCDDSNGTPEPQEEEKCMPGSQQRFYADRRYEPYFYSPTTEPSISCALVTPTVQNGTYEVTSMPYKMPLPPRSLPLEEECGTNTAVRTSFLNPRRVSPSSQNCTSFESPSPAKPTIAHASKVLTSAGQKYLVPPSLVSPYNNQSGDDVSDDSYAPTIPALVDIACAASNAKCH
jgi:hypothetical protein